jgi:hypothetical protein
MRIDFTVTDDEGHELAFGGTSSQPTLKALADELYAMVERGEFPHAERCDIPPGEGRA